MDYTNDQNPSSVQPRDFLDDTTESPLSVRTVEPNRSESVSTEQRLYGAYRNTNRDVRELTPDSTPDAPLIYPLNDEFNPNIARELNSETQPPMSQENMQNEAPRNTSVNPMQPIPMPNFITASRSRNNTAPELYTPLGEKTAPISNPQNLSTGYTYSYNPNSNLTGISTQNSSTGYPNLTTSYQMDSQRNMYLPRTTPYYNMPAEGYENLNDFEAAEKDMEYLRQLYPRVWQLIQNEINEECDKLEYEGSCMFDEYPDKTTLDRIIHRIYERIKDYDGFKEYDAQTSEDGVSANQLNFHPFPRRNWIEDFTRILFLNEIHNRRRRHRSRRRWFY